MPEVWGELAKAQDDNQKINEAINEAIVNHETDPTAHLGSGESLEAHKTSEMIDHPAGSIVKDKDSFVENSFQTYFETIDRWIPSGTVLTGTARGFQMESNSGGLDPASLVGNGVFSGGLLSYLVNSFFQTKLFAFAEDDDDFDCIFGITGGASWGYGFKIIDGVAYGYFKYGADNRTVNLGALETGVTYTFRAQYDKDTGYIYFYINGVLVGSLSRLTSNFYFDQNFIFSFNATGGNWGEFSCFSLLTATNY